MNTLTTFALEIDRLLAEARAALEESPHENVRAMVEGLPSTNPGAEDSDGPPPFRLAFAGQYSAGKSTLISALTGRADIARGAGIVTDQVTTYPWGPLLLIDTPGVGTSIRPEHDVLAKRQIAEAELIVFVITNELMDSAVAASFRQLAIDSGKAHDMLLVVNKMDRHAGGNTAKARRIMADDLAGVLAPFGPDDVRTTFVDAQQFLEAVSEPDPAAASELRESSGIDILSVRLTRLAADRGHLGRLTAPLFTTEGVLTEALGGFPTDDPDSAELEELLLRQRRTLTAALRETQSEAGTRIGETARRVREQGRTAAEVLTTDADLEQANDRIKAAQREVERLADELAQQLQGVFTAEADKLDQNIDALLGSELAAALLPRLIARVEAAKLPLTREQARLLKSTSAAGDSLGRWLVKNSEKPQAGPFKGFLPSRQYSGTPVHEGVKSVGKRMGVKFKPWGAVRWTKRIATTGRVLSVAGIVVSVGLEWKQDLDEQRRARELQGARRAVRAGFDDAAFEIETYFDNETQTYVVHPLQREIDEVDARLAELRSMRNKTSNSISRINDLLERTRDAIARIHAAEDRGTAESAHPPRGLMG